MADSRCCWLYASASAHQAESCFCRVSLLGCSLRGRISTGTGTPDPPPRLPRAPPRRPSPGRAHVKKGGKLYCQGHTKLIAATAAATETAVTGTAVAASRPAPLPARARTPPQPPEPAPGAGPRPPTGPRPITRSRPPTRPHPHPWPRLSGSPAPRAVAAPVLVPGVGPGVPAGSVPYGEKLLAGPCQEGAGDGSWPWPGPWRDGTAEEPAPGLGGEAFNPGPQGGGRHRGNWPPQQRGLVAPRAPQAVRVVGRPRSRGSMPRRGMGGRL